VINRIEINGLLEIEATYMETFYAAAASATISDGVQDARIVLREAESLPYQITDLGSGSDKFYGGDEYDLITTNGGADWIMAGAGDDMVIVNGTVLSTDKNPFDGKSNYVLIDTGTGDDIVEITTDFAGEVQLVSGGGSDTLVIEGEAASYSWGADKDSLVLTSADATLVLTNQMAYDENQVFSYVEFISIDPVTGEETSQIFQIDPNADPVEGGIVTLLGTDKDDTLEIEWDSGPSSIAGLKGDDIINGGMSDDNLDGGEGDDLLFGDSGDDSLAGGEGEDLLAGDHGSDLLFGGLGDDVYKIDLEYDGFLDVAGYDNVVLNEDGTINYELSPETPWADVIGGVDTIIDDGGTDRIWITNFQPTLNPFDQYKEMLSIDSDGTLIMKWGWDAESPSSYQHTLKEGFEYQL
ncbi:MAG: calcium-binding protein, partial [Alphaproteobacteria bacterium]|nr:calcium-binding protein [Alphaproteobacteria bacterium]